jgi:hypothetical protein
MVIKSKECIERAKSLGWPINKDESAGHWVAEAPGGYQYFITEEPQPTNAG